MKTKGTRLQLRPLLRFPIDGSRMLSAYRASRSEKLWIITKAADEVRSSNGDPDPGVRDYRECCRRTHAPFLSQDRLDTDDAYP